MIKWQCDTHGACMRSSASLARRCVARRSNTSYASWLIVWPAHRAYDVAALFFDYTHTCPSYANHLVLTVICMCSSCLNLINRASVPVRAVYIYYCNLAFWSICSCLDLNYLGRCSYGRPKKDAPPPYGDFLCFQYSHKPNGAMLAQRT
jgi:hypothetical protein